MPTNVYVENITIDSELGLTRSSLLKSIPSKHLSPMINRYGQRGFWRNTLTMNLISTNTKSQKIGPSSMTKATII